jgi:DNA polymerase I
MADKKRLFLIDANGYIHRAYHAMPPLNNSRGEPVQAIYGFARMLIKIIRDGRPDYMAVCFDTAGTRLSPIIKARAKKSMTI